MRIILNGQVREVPEGTTIAGLLDNLEIPREAIAVEVNREVVPRSCHGERRLQADDRVEIVTFVGGG